MIANLEMAEELAGERAISIRVTPVTSGARIWAFASTTNNVTHQVTLVTPSRK